jgi:Zn-dependent protease
MAMEDIIHKIFIAIPGFLIAISVHEWAHGMVALKFGDDTAKRIGRLTLNPIAHIDLVGTVILPLVLTVLFGTPFGYAKPVPVDSRYFKNIRKATFWVSFAGPLANIIIAFICSFLFAIVVTQVSAEFTFYKEFQGMLQSAILINLILAVFNLIPFPPLDGSKMLLSFLSYNQARKFEELERFTFLFFMVLWMTNIFSYLMIPAFVFTNVVTNLFINILA